MSAPDIQAIYAAAYTRIATDSAGSPLRAALGSTSSVIPVEDIGKALPALPLIAWQGGGIDATEFDVDDYPFGLWVYDSPLYGYRRISGLVTLARACYPHDWLANSYTKAIASPKEAPDIPLALNMRPIWFAVSARQ